jgi:formaldehyde-activating enzyme involved in methanogenesis
VAFQQLNSQLHLPLLIPAAPKLVTKPAVLRVSRMHLLLLRLNQKMRAMLQLAESKRVNQTK